MTDKVRKWIEQENLIEQGDFVLAGVSGGADSVCLLRLLLDLQKALRISLEVVHVEHGIRDEESREDARFVEALCEKWGIVCHTFHLNVPEYAKQHGMGLEEAARTLRYNCYKHAAAEIAEPGSGRRRMEKGDLPAAGIKVALAHHADDNAETMLFQMARGSGLLGLCGMRPQRELAEGAMIIRPLLMTTRREIEQYLSEIGQSYRQDSTNLDTDYSRNRIRHEVLPQLEKVNSQVVSHMTQSAALLSELSDYLAGEVERVCLKTCRFERTPDGKGLEEEETRPAQKKNAEETASCIIRRELFLQYPVILQKEAVHTVLAKVAGSRKDISSAHVEAVLNLAGLQVGRQISLPYQMTAERVYEGIRIRHVRKTGGMAPEQYEITAEELRLAEREEGLVIPLPEGELRLRVRDFSGEMWKIRKKTYTKWLNYDKIKCGLLLRKRAGGDYLTIDEKGHRKKLKEYFIEEKIPKEQRDKIWLLAEDAHVIWVVGGRISASYRIEENTRKILEVQISGGNYREDQED